MRNRRECGWSESVISMAIAAIVLVAAMGATPVLAVTAGASVASGGTGATMPDAGDRPLDQDGEQTPSVFAPQSGQEYELAFFIAAVVLTVLVAGGFAVVIWFHGRGSSTSDVEAAPEDIEA